MQALPQTLENIQSLLSLILLALLTLNTLTFSGIVVAVVLFLCRSRRDHRVDNDSKKCRIGRP